MRLQGHAVLCDLNAFLHSTPYSDNSSNKMDGKLLRIWDTRAWSQGNRACPPKLQLLGAQVPSTAAGLTGAAALHCVEGLFALGSHQAACHAGPQGIITHPSCLLLL